MSLPVAILAGGLATRLRPLTERIPKSLLEVAGKPFAIHQIELLARHGIDRLVFCLGFLGDQVAEALGDGGRWHVRIDYVLDGAIRLGTGGALKNALPKLGEAFLVLYGDSYLECDYQRVAEVFMESGKLGLMTVLKNANQWDKSNISFREGTIVRYDKVNCGDDMQHIDYGLGALRSEVFSHYPANTSFDLLLVYQELIQKNQMAAMEMTNRLYEIGSITGLQETHKHLLKQTELAL